MRCRKLPVEVEAFDTSELLHAFARDWNSLPSVIVEAYERGALLVKPDALLVQTLEGEQVATANHMMMVGVKGELYPCRKDIFEATYEVVVPEVKE